MREFNEFISYVCESIKLKLQFNIVLDAFWLKSGKFIGQNINSIRRSFY